MRAGWVNGAKMGNPQPRLECEGWPSRCGGLPALFQNIRKSIVTHLSPTMRPLWYLIGSKNWPNFGQKKGARAGGGRKTPEMGNPNRD